MVHGRAPLRVTGWLLCALLCAAAAGCGGTSPAPSSPPDSAPVTAAQTLGSTQTAATHTTKTTAKGGTAASTAASAPTREEITTAMKTTTETTTAAPTTEKSTTVPGPRPTFAGPQGTESFTNLTYNNNGGKMGDCDGPAYCVYSRVGYNRASIDILLSELKINVFRQSDGEPLTAYIFLGADIFFDNGQFANCFDAGLGYNTGKKKWVLFYNILEHEAYQDKWYMSAVCLDDTHDYRLVLDTSVEDGWTVMVLYDLTLGGTETDRATFRTMYTRKDGSNTLFYQDYALDYPDRVKRDPQGRPSDSWADITLYNTDENVYMRNLRIVNATLNDRPWTAEKTRNRSVWPDCTMHWIDYPAVRVSRAALDTELQIDLDMNRP